LLIPNPSPTISATEACDRLGVPYTTLTRWLAQPERFLKPPGFKVGRKWRVYLDVVEGIERGSLELVDPRVAARRARERAEIAPEDEEYDEDAYGLVMDDPSVPDLLENGCLPDDEDGGGANKWEGTRP
jgi:hypothetical protein